MKLGRAAERLHALAAVAGEPLPLRRLRAQTWVSGPCGGTWKVACLQIVTSFGLTWLVKICFQSRGLLNLLSKSYHHYFGHRERYWPCSVVKRETSDSKPNSRYCVGDQLVTSDRKQAESISCVYICIRGYFPVPPATESQQ